MAKNKLADLTDHLFAALERLNDEDLKGDELKAEIARAGAIGGVAAQIIGAGNLALAAARTNNTLGDASAMPALLGLDGARQLPGAR